MNPVHGGRRAQEPGVAHVFDVRVCKWLVIKAGVFEWVKIRFMYPFRAEVVVNENGRGGYSGIRGDITA